MKVIHQLVASAVPGDAVTEQAFTWRGLLRLWGVDGEILADHVHPAFARRAFKVRRGDELMRRADAIVLHYSLWSRAADLALRSDAGLGFCYHNITPGDLLRTHNPRVADLCDLGRARLPAFAGQTATVTADSSFNADELARFGVGPAAIVPLLLSVRPNAPTTKASAPSLILFVGRIAPNKRLEDLIRAFASYQRTHEPEASLVLVGSPRGFESYEAELRELVAQSGAKRVTFTGRVSRADRDAWYGRATVYASTSVHEGFCAPLVEAMADGLPVVARDAGAVAETLGGAGLVLPDAEPERFAAALAEAAASAETRATLAEAARRRLAEFAPERISARLRTALEPLLA